MKVKEEMKLVERMKLEERMTEVMVLIVVGLAFLVLFPSWKEQ